MVIARAVSLVLNFIGASCCNYFKNSSHITCKYVLVTSLPHMHLSHL